MQKTGISHSLTVNIPGSTARHARMGGLVLVVLVCLGAVWQGVAGIAMAQDASDDEWTTEHFQLARQAQLRNDLDTAAQEYRAIIAHNPKFAGAQLNLGIVYHQQRKYREAVKVLQSAVALQPDLLGAQVFLGIDEYLVQDLKGASQHLGIALRLKPDDRQAGFYLALAYLASDQPEKAAQQLRKTAQYFPDDPEILYYQGEAYLNGMAQGLDLLRQAGGHNAIYHWAQAIAAEQKRDLVEVIEEYLKALAYDSSIAELYLRLAVAFTRAGMPDLAAKALETYKVLNPQQDPTTINLEQMAAEFPTTQQDFSEHKEAFLRLWEAVPAAQPTPGMPEVADEFVNRALMAQLASANAADLKEFLKLFLKGDFGKATTKIRPRVDRHADDWLSAYLLTRCFLLTSNDDAAQTVLETHLLPHFSLPSVALLRVEVESRLALRYFNLVVARQPDSLLAKLLVARSSAASGKDKEAIAEYREVLNLDPGRRGVHMAIGEIFETQLQWEPAIQEYNAELALDPDNALALAHLGHACTQAREPDQAIQALDRLLASNPTDGPAFADLGKAWTLKGDSRKAIAAYEQAIRYDPSANDIHYRLFQLYTKMGEAATAQKHLAAFKQGEEKQKQVYQESMSALEQARVKKDP